MHAGDELKPRLAEVGGDARVRQRRAEGRGMGRQRKAAIGLGAQAFFLDAAANALSAFKPTSCSRCCGLVKMSRMFVSMEGERVSGL